MRGLPPAILLVLLHRRYNPACAGTTPPSAQQRIAVSIQPRVCGDYALCCLIQPPSSDTTPRVRGLRVRNAIARLGNRYNPACAGTTSMTIYCWLLPPIQPRVCGDYVVLTAMALSLYDTTPRVRGLLTVIIKCRRVVRYNPACAGTTVSRAALYRQIPIQPRVCGDYLLWCDVVLLLADTTPRVRGLQFIPATGSGTLRYNPACAGTTATYIMYIFSRSIQPRVCGDYLPTSSRTRPFTDTTPRVRGLLFITVVTLVRSGYNPACAGTTHDSRRCSYRYAIQPRVCGDYFLQYPISFSCYDTTPRVRGLRRIGGEGAPAARYNPACAGTT